MTARKFGATMGVIGLLAWNPLAFVGLTTLAGIALGVKLARRLGSGYRQRQVMPPERRPQIQEWQLQHIPIEQRDWARRNLFN